MSNLGWCNSGQHEECWSVVKQEMGIHPYTICQCNCHRKEKYMAKKGKTTATAERVEDGDTDVLLRVIDEDSNHRIPLSWEGAHAARDALAGLLHEHASRSIVQRLEGDLDGVMDVLMEADDGDDLSLEQGWARGLALAISYMRGSEVEQVKEQAMDRYEERTAS